MNIFDYTISLLSVRDIWMFGTVLLCFLVMVDDIFVDILSLLLNVKPHLISKEEFVKMNSISEKKTAILIANWHEAEVLERMVAGNIANIAYSNYEFLLGVYPNDTETLAAARRAEKKFKNVRVIVNNLKGPTSKGQMINRMVYYIDQFNRYSPKEAYDLIVIQDAEDIIHKYSLKLINLRSLDYDFIQIPVFSLDVPLSKLTAGIYIDEFTESHTKNLLVRDRCKAGVPSAGVGTAVSYHLVSKLLKLQSGHFLNEKTLTEDYYLGLTCYDLGVKAHFSCEYFINYDSRSKEIKKEFIATREFFPQKIKTSIKQKTRWSLGICLQSMEHKRNKSSHFFGNYFLWRDRKGLVSAPLFISAILFTIYFLIGFVLSGVWPTLDRSLDQTAYYDIFLILLWTNLFLSIFRIIQRAYLVNKIYHVLMASLVPVRWVLSNYINTMAMFNAIDQWLRSKINGTVPVWSKTDHIIPVGFGEGIGFVEELASETPRRIPLVPIPRPVQSVQSEIQLLKLE